MARARQTERDIYSGGDPREIPAYSIPEAAHYLLIPSATLRSWVMGRKYPVKAGQKFFKPVLLIPNPSKPQLSFINLVEAHVLDAIRRQHEIPLETVRQGVAYLRKNLGSLHPLADQRMETDGRDLFAQIFGRLVNISQEGQFAIRELLGAHLERIERDLHGAALRLYPFTRKRQAREPKYIVMDPRVSFGRPVLSGTGIPTSVIADRYKAGESVDQLAKDYDRERPEIEEAIRCELAEAA
ncbi:MAG TPA: DUF433 domain-containing protein [Candidatus Limnocylindrales bacterium]|nr:DUF433 domain-containing protein [Candidatus Limnocylindrales bacterium]